MKTDEDNITNRGTSSAKSRHEILRPPIWNSSTTSISGATARKLSLHLCRQERTWSTGGGIQQQERYQLQKTPVDCSFNTKNDINCGLFG